MTANTARAPVDVHPRERVRDGDRPTHARQHSRAHASGDALARAFNARRRVSSLPRLVRVKVCAENRRRSGVVRALGRLRAWCVQRGVTGERI